MIFWMLGIALAASCAPAVLQPSQLRPPSSIDDLLKNMWSTAQSGLILREDFYTEDNLKRAFGGASVAFPQRCADNTDARITEFPAWFPRYSTYRIDPGRVDVQRLVGADNRVGAYAYALWSSGMNTPHFDDIERLFGKRWTECAPPALPNPHRIITAPTHPKGDSCIVYGDPEGTSGPRIVFAFWSDASLAAVSAQVGWQQDSRSGRRCAE